MGGTRAGGSERGQILVIVALSLAVLIGFVGLAIDGGRIYLERRDAQGAADHAAIAAAQWYCSQSGTATAARNKGMAAAAANGYADADPNIAVGVTQVAGKPGHFKAAITASDETAFMSVLGISRFDVGVDATAGCSSGGGSGPGALYAGGNSCGGASEYIIKISAAGQRVFGGVHAAGDVRLESVSNWWSDDETDDPFTYEGSMSINDPSKNMFWVNPPPATGWNVFQEADPPTVPPSYPGVEDKDWPSGYAPTDVATRLAAYETMALTHPKGHWFDEKITEVHLAAFGEGIYYTTQEIEIGSLYIDQNVTLVAEKHIKIGTSGTPLTPWEFTPFVDGLLAFSGLEKPADKKCSEFVIELSGDDVIWNGVIWAPGGQVKFAGNRGLHSPGGGGSVIAWSIGMSGQNHNISYDDSLFPSAAGEIELIE